MKFTKNKLYTVPIWVKLPGLDFKYCGPKGLSKIGSLIGKPLMTDGNTKKKIGLHFARLLIEVEVGTVLPFISGMKKGVLMEPKIQYDQLSYIIFATTMDIVRVIVGKKIAYGKHKG